MEITISAEAINLPDGYEMYLEDRVEGTFTLLDATTNYQKVLTENTNGAGRYYIHTSQAVLNVDENNLNTVRLFVDTNNTVHIRGIQEASEMTVFNITGQKVFATSFVGNGNNSISIPKVTTGLYLIQLNTNKGSITKKIILK